jgi:hypothetical protein
MMKSKIREWMFGGREISQDVLPDSEGDLIDSRGEPPIGDDTAAVDFKERVKAIVYCDEAKGRDELAKFLAVRTEVTVQAAREILAVAATSNPRPDARPLSGFERHLQRCLEDERATPHQKTMTDTEQEVSRIHANYELARGGRLQ